MTLWGHWIVSICGTRSWRWRNLINRRYWNVRIAASPAASCFWRSGLCPDGMVSQGICIRDELLFAMCWKESAEYKFAAWEDLPSSTSFTFRLGSATADSQAVGLSQSISLLTIVRPGFHFLFTVDWAVSWLPSVDDTTRLLYKSWSTSSALVTESNDRGEVLLNSSCGVTVACPGHRAV